MPIEGSNGRALLVESLQRLTPAASYKQLPRVLILLSNVPCNNEPIAKKKYVEILLTKDEQDSIVCVSKLATISDKHARKLLTPLLHVVDILKEMDCKNIHSIQARQESFVRQFFTNLATIASTVKDETMIHSICDSVSTCIGDLVDDVDRHLPALFGVSSCLSSTSFPFNSEQLEKVIQSLHIFAGINKSFENRQSLSMPACVMLLNQPNVSNQCNGLCFDRAMRHVTFEAYSSSSLFASAVPLALAAARNDAQMGDAILHRLLSVMARVVTTASALARSSKTDTPKKKKKSKLSVNSNNTPKETSLPKAITEPNDVELTRLRTNSAALSDGLAGVAALPICSAAHRLTRVAAALRGGLLGGGIPRTRLRQSCGDGLLKLLNYRPQFSNELVRSLVDEFFQQHDRYRDALETDDSIQVAHYESILKPLVMCMAGVAVHDKHRHVKRNKSDATVAEQIVRPLISRVELTFMPVDILLLEQLTEIAIVDRTALHSEIVDLLIGVFLKVIDSHKTKKLPSTIANALLALATYVEGASRRDALLRRLLRLHQLFLQRVPSTLDDVQASNHPALIASGVLLDPIARLLPDLSGVGAVREWCRRAEYARTHDDKRAHQHNDTLLLKAAVKNGDAKAHKSATESTAAKEAAERDKGVPEQDSDGSVHRASDELLHLLRSLWFGVTLWSMVRDSRSNVGTVSSNNNSRFSDAWLPQVTSIAARMPPLVPFSSHAWLNYQAELTASLKHGFATRGGPVRQALLSLLPAATQRSLGTLLRTLTPEHAVYVMSVHSLELKRVGRSLRRPAALTYVADEALVDAGLAPLLAAVADELAMQFTAFMTQLGPTPQRAATLAHAAKSLLVDICHRDTTVRAAADRHLWAMSRRFPQILWNSKCLTTLLDLFDIVGKSVEQKDYVTAHLLPQTRYRVDLPDDAAGKQKLLSDYTKLAIKWLEKALVEAPVETQAILHQYMHNFRRLSTAFLHHVGFSLAVNISSRVQSQGGLNASDGVTMNDNAANFVNALELKAQYSGEVDGMLKLLIQFSGNTHESLTHDGLSVADSDLGLFEQEVGPVKEQVTIQNSVVVAAVHDRQVMLKRMAQVLLAKYRTYVARFAHNQRPPAADVSAFGATLFRAAAFLIARRTADARTQELIHLLAWAPVLAFSKASMRTGVFAWSWLMAARPDYSLALLTEMHDAWCWIIEQRRGLFAYVERDGAVNILGEPEEGDDDQAGAVGGDAGGGVSDSDSEEEAEQVERQDDMEEAEDSSESSSASHGGAEQTQRASDADVAPHRVWLAFLEERHTVWSQASSAHTGILRRMADAAVASPALLSDERSSLPARCELLRWCLRFTEPGGGGGGNALNVVELERRERVYRSALGWFGSPPAWRVPRHRAEAERDVNALQSFADAIERDTIFKTAEKARRASSHATLAASGGSATGSGVERDSVRNMPLSPLRDSAPVDETIDAVLKSLREMQQLILLLIGHEIDRYVTWANPLSRPDRVFVDSERHAQRHRRASARDWRAHINAAWRVAPRVALRLADRFPHVTTLRDLLATRLTASGIGRASDDGLAVLRAVDIVREGLSRAAAGLDPLRELADWAPTTPMLALKLLTSTYGGDARVVSYAVHSLRRSSVRSIIFMLPQLVQALRYDRTGLVEDFLGEAGAHSTLLAHQIIWNTQTYTEPDENGNIDSIIAPIAKRLSARIENGFSAAQRREYRLIFDFFENFTNTSALLIDLKHEIESKEPGLAKDSLRARLTERLFAELDKTPVQQVVGVGYLPTNPDWMVHDIVAEKSTCLQSAAKVPLFVSFMVSDRQRLPRHVRDDISKQQKRIENKSNEKQVESNVSESGDDDDAFDGELKGREADVAEREDIRKILGKSAHSRMNDVVRDEDDDDDDEDDPELVEELVAKSIVAEQTALEELDPDADVEVVPELRESHTKRRKKKRSVDSNSALTTKAGSSLTTKAGSSTSSSSTVAKQRRHTGSGKTRRSDNNVEEALATAVSQLNDSSNIEAFDSELVAAERQHAAMRRLLQSSPINLRKQACIFKAGDDIRQDMLAIQIIGLFKQILDEVGLDVYLYPYKVIATKPGCGIIEVVPNAKSRDAVGKYLDGNLVDYFISKYGPMNSESFLRARNNYIKSMAAYAVVSYILQVKDRHNGNILIDDEGHLVHIDFGFIFDISPGGDFGFEVSPFKLSQEMIDVMGGHPGAEQFTWFMEQGVRAFLAVRAHMDSICTLVELMLDTKLPCFKSGCLNRLRERFFPDKSEHDAAAAMSGVMLRAFSTIPFYTSYLYDVFQQTSQGISM